MSWALILIGIILFIIGAVILGAYAAVAGWISGSIPPSQITNSIGQSEGSLFGTFGWGFILIGIIFIAIGILDELSNSGGGHSGFYRG